MASKNSSRSDRENALLAAARQEAAGKRTPANVTGPRARARPGEAGPARLAQAATAREPAAQSAAPREATVPDTPPVKLSAEQKLATLMAAALDEKTQRAQSHRRWKIAVGAALVLALLWALIQFARLKH